MERMIFPGAKILYDFQLAQGPDELCEVLYNINLRGYRLVAVTQDPDKYTVIFERPANG